MKIVREINLIPGRKYAFLNVVKLGGINNSIPFVFNYIDSDNKRIFFHDLKHKTEEDFTHNPEDLWVEIFNFGR